MLATFKSSVLLKLLLQHLKSKQRLSLNFTFESDIVKIQSSSEFVYDTFIQGAYDNYFISKSISIMITTAINLLKEDNGDISIEPISDKVVLFKQGSITIPFNTTHEDRIDINWKGIELQGKIDSKVLSSIANSHRNLINVAKTLDVGIPSVVVRSGMCYCMYSNTILINPTAMILPDFELPYNTFNNISKSINTNSINILTDSVKRMLLLQFGNDGFILTPYKTPNDELIISIQDKLSTLEYVDSFDINSFDNFEFVFKYFPKESLTLSAYVDKTIGLSFSSNNNQKVASGMKSLDTIFNIIISMTQFNAIYKTFKSYKELDFYKGSDIVCLKSQTGQTLMLSGVTF